MNDPMVIFMIGFAIICLSGITYGMYVTQKNLTTGWKEFSIEEGLIFSSGFLPFISPKIKGNYKGYEVNTSIKSESSGRNSGSWYTVIKMALPDCGLLNLHIKSKLKYNINLSNLFSGGPVIEKRDEIKTFENSFESTCSHSEKGKKIITGEIEEELMTFTGILDIEILDNYIYYKVDSGYMCNRENLKKAHELLWKMAKNIS